MRVAAVCINDAGETAARLLEREMQDVTVYRHARNGGLQDLVADLFARYDGIVFFCAVGIAVRMIAPFVSSKYTDPAVVAVDNGTRYAVSLLSGHEGGANALSYSVSRILGAHPVVTTATEARKDLVLGIGARKGVSKEQVLSAVSGALESAGCTTTGIRAAATIGRKCREQGVVSALKELSLPVVRVTGKSIRTVSGAFSPSAAARHLDVPAVAEPCAVLASRDGELIAPVWKENGVTVAIARERVQPLPDSEEEIHEHCAG
jgi:cobalamin biosynthesis protein CbiG